MEFLSVAVGVAAAVVAGAVFLVWRHRTGVLDRRRMRRRTPDFTNEDETRARVRATLQSVVTVFFVLLVLLLVAGVVIAART